MSLKNGGKVGQKLSQLKSLLFIFQASLEESPDDKSAMQLIGLLLFKYYRKEALEPYLKILCSSGLKCRSEDAFDVSKTILWKIIQRHSACFEPSLSFYVVNIDVTDEKGIIYIIIYSSWKEVGYL